MQVYTRREVNNGRRLIVFDLQSQRGILIEDAFRFNHLLYKATINDPPDGITPEALRQREYSLAEIPGEEFNTLYRQTRRFPAGYEELSRQEAPEIMRLFFADGDLEGLIKD